MYIYICTQFISYIDLIPIYWPKKKKNRFFVERREKGLWTRLLGLTRKLRVATGKTVISVSVLPDQKGGCKSTSRGWINYLSLISQSLLNLFLHEIGFNDSLNFHLSIAIHISPYPCVFPFLKGSSKRTPPELDKWNFPPVGMWIWFVSKKYEQWWGNWRIFLYLLQCIIEIYRVFRSIELFKNNNPAILNIRYTLMENYVSLKKKQIIVLLCNCYARWYHYNHF